ncbi:DUF2207 domain-containing protein [Cryobacterium sp. TMT1-21]|uniref:DUF2207 domain-containing protein n=1 Tax=Cryobacterium shii TaxID=1259235 RepID=A0AAQ2HG74_9MICO|nr:MULTISPECIES: DUF2207 domain-containing protein [Cryobacterium]TFC51268.1 DUF2207 domain-containing protein [Cryobacterium shii]TFC85220.1 DUF2207 domain-containing protein [Cryobacterium sp. TmT2-59]TFD15832.1 DUF2207 domain-containing protein [Cryobacterium sp. TMT4-10]TFD17096.1 DUF2207 domain-containing protein [Cryobacterium sp. TMT1-21]TFD26233.1 DUF2207 domain-containing protein [Cryobacterium sp. TMT2-23]
MRRSVRFLLIAALGGLTLGGLAAPAAAAPAIVATDTSDFTFDSWHADFRLGLTGDGHSALTTTETIVARFPESDQNRGIRRAIPTHYDGHPTDLTLVSVTDENGRPRATETETTDVDGDQFLEVTIAAEDYVHGANTYVIEYRQVDVTLLPTDAAAPEFYWKANGTGWTQPFGDVSATLTVAPDLAPRLTGQSACYQGGVDSGEPCADLTETSVDGATVIDASAGSLGPYQGLTVSVAFEPGTFVPRDQSFTANPFPGIGLGALLLGLVLAAVAAVARATRWRSAPGRPTIIAEYLPPKGVNLLQCGDVARASAKAITAQFLSFAVRGNLRVLEGTGKKHYLLELRHAQGLDPAEKAVLRLLFPGLHEGTRRDLKSKDTVLGKGLTKQLQAVRQQVLTDGLREKKGGRLRGWLLTGALLTGVICVAGSIGGLVTEVGGAWPAVILIFGALVSIATIALAASVRPLTPAGAELRDYLAGVRLYIGVAETERLRVLQSPEGALRSPYRPDAASVLGPDVVRDAALDPADPLQVLKLYERLLPFAVLFGQETAWSQVLGDYYARSGLEPDWYAGSAPFSPVWFAAGLNSFSSSTSASWSGSASSSSSSGSGGGGSVGGGGGGGGGGGV